VRLTADDEVGCIVITGAGTRAFSAGGDIHEQREDDRRYAQAELDTRNAVRSRGSYEISACPKPTIGMINGLAYGGGPPPPSPPGKRGGGAPPRFPLPAPASRPLNSTPAFPHPRRPPVAQRLLLSPPAGRAQGAP